MNTLALKEKEIYTLNESIKLLEQKLKDRERELSAIGAGGVTSTPITKSKITSDGSTASYYELPKNATELQHLISFRNMNAQVGEIFRACYRYGLVNHSPEIRDIKKIIFYANAELERLENTKCKN